MDLNDSKLLFSGNSLLFKKILYSWLYVSFCAVSISKCSTVFKSYNECCLCTEHTCFRLKYTQFFIILITQAT